MKLDGNNPSYKKIRLNTLDKTGDQFDPTTIDQSLLKEKCTQITLLGVLHIDQDQTILEDANRIVLSIRTKIINDTSQEDFLIGDIASPLGIDKKYAQILFTLVSMYGSFWSSASSNSTVNTPYGYERFSITNEGTFDFYIKFKDIYTVIDNYYIRQEEYKRREREQDYSGIPSTSIVGKKLFGAGVQKSAAVNTELFDLNMFADTRGYLKKIASQASQCYQYQLYDACFVLIRKLTEALIIEVFERHRLENKIKDSDGHYFFLSQLIGSLLNEKSWNLSRNTVNGLPKLKKLGDASAHNRRFMAQKSDIDKLEDLRMILEELIHLIDYSSWNNKLQIGQD